MNLNLKSFSQLVQDMGAALQSSASSLIDVSVGSVVRAIFEANASVVLWLQWLILQVLQTTRASTSTGTDLDSWMADFSLSRLPAVSSTGVVTFSRFVSLLPANIPAGSLVKTSDGLLSFTVVADQSISIWQPSLSAYVLPSGVASADVPVSCLTAGSTGNVLAGSISTISSSLPGIDQCTNANPLSNGVDSESDQAFRDRFQTYIASRSRATLAAVTNAIKSVQQGLGITILENTGINGSPSLGSFLVLIDDGTGYPSTSLVSAVAAAVDAVRPIGTMFAILPPQVQPVDVAMTVILDPAANTSTYIAAIQTYVAEYLNSLPIGKPASVTRVAQNAYLAGSLLDNVTDIQLNGTGLDISPPPGTVIKSRHISVGVNDG